MVNKAVYDQHVVLVRLGNAEKTLLHIKKQVLELSLEISEVSGKLDALLNPEESKPLHQQFFVGGAKS